VKRIIDTVQNSPALLAGHRHPVTFDESGANYDSGFIQPIDFLLTVHAPS